MNQTISHSGVAETLEIRKPKLIDSCDKLRHLYLDMTMDGFSKYVVRRDDENSE